MEDRECVSNGLMEEGGRGGRNEETAACTAVDRRIETGQGRKRGQRERGHTPMGAMVTQ